jgi:hypothetical protein
MYFHVDEGCDLFKISNQNINSKKKSILHHPLQMKLKREITSLREANLQTKNKLQQISYIIDN